MKIVQLIWLIILFFIKISSAEAEPYFGLNLGASILTVKKNLSFVITNFDNINSNFVNSNSRFQGNSYGFRAQLLLGYNFYPFCWNIFSSQNGTQNNFLKKFFFAIEGDANYNSNLSSASIRPWFSGTNASIREELNWGFDIFFLGKYRQARNVSFFFGPGVSWGNFETSSSRRTAGNLGISGSSSTWLTGWAIKTGVEVAWQFMNIVFTYQFSSFNKKTLSRNEPLTGNNLTATYRPMVNSITLGLNINDFASLFSGNSNSCPNCVEEVVEVRNGPPPPPPVKVAVRQPPSYAGGGSARYPSYYDPNPGYREVDDAMNIDSDRDNDFSFYSY
jgi:hypothetical protein